MFDINENLKYEYQLTLCKSNKEPIQMLESIYGLKYEGKFPTTDEISFNIPFYIMNNGKKEKNKLWDLVKGDYLIHCKKIYDENIIDEKYFFIVKPKESDNDKEVKEILAYSLEYELNNKIIRGYNLLSRKLYSLTNEIDTEGFQIGVLNYISTLTSWTIGDIDAELLNKFRLFDVTEETILGFLVNTVQKSFGCVFIFDTVNKKIHAKKIENIGKNSGLYLSEENYIKTFERQIDHDEIITRLFVFGNNDISVNSINPSGSSFIEDFSFYKNTNYMSQSLIDSLNAYESLLETKTGEFNGYLSEIDNFESQLTIKTNELSQLTIDLSVIQDNIDIAIKNGNSLTDLNTQKANKEIEIDNKELEITAIQNQINAVYNNISTLRESIKKTNNFTSEQLIDLDFFVREKTWTDTNYETAEDLWNEIPNIFSKINQPPITFDIDSIDFTQSVTCQRDWKRFILGDILNIEHSKFNFYIQVRLIGYSHDVDNYSLKLNFSNKDSIDDPNQYMNDLLKNAIIAGTTVDYSKYKWNKSEDNSNQIANIINNALDSAKNNVLAGKNQDVIISERGISLTDITNPNEQMRIINNVLCMTDDNWNTAKLAITPGKIHSEYLFGKILAGVNVQIDASDELGNKTFTVDSSGVKISGLALEITNGGIPESQINPTSVSNWNSAQATANNSIQQGVSYSNGFKFDPSVNGTGLTVTLGGIGTYSNKVRSVLNAIEGIKIQNRPTILLGEEGLGNVWSNAVDQLKIDTDGNLLLSGKIQIGDTFSVTPTGVLSATGATISGNVDITGTLKIAGIDILDEIDGKISSSGLNNLVNININKGVTARSYFDENGNLIMDHLASITWSKVDKTGAVAADVNARPNTWTPTASEVGAVANNQTSVFNTLTNNGTLPGLFMDSGQLYINASYISAGILQGLTIRTANTGNTRVELSSGWADINMYHSSANIFRIEDNVINTVLYNPSGYGMIIGNQGYGTVSCAGEWDFSEASIDFTNAPITGLNVVAKLG